MQTVCSPRSWAAFVCFPVSTYLLIFIRSSILWHSLVYTLPVLSHLNILTTISITSLLFSAPYYSRGNGGLGWLSLAQGHTAELEFELGCLAPESEPSMTVLCGLTLAGGTECLCDSLP